MTRIQTACLERWLATIGRSGEPLAQGGPVADVSQKAERWQKVRRKIEAQLAKGMGFQSRENATSIGGSPCPGTYSPGIVLVGSFAKRRR